MLKVFVTTNTCLSELFQAASYLNETVSELALRPTQALPGFVRVLRLADVAVTSVHISIKLFRERNWLLKIELG